MFSSPRPSAGPTQSTPTNPYQSQGQAPSPTPGAYPTQSQPASNPYQNPQFGQAQQQSNPYQNPQFGQAQQQQPGMGGLGAPQQPGMGGVGSPQQPYGYQTPLPIQSTPQQQFMRDMLTGSAPQQAQYGGATPLPEFNPETYKYNPNMQKPYMPQRPLTPEQQRMQDIMGIRTPEYYSQQPQQIDIDSGTGSSPQMNQQQQQMLVERLRQLQGGSPSPQIQQGMGGFGAPQQPGMGGIGSLPQMATPAPQMATPFTPAPQTPLTPTPQTPLMPAPQTPLTPLPSRSTGFPLKPTSSPPMATPTPARPTPVAPPMASRIQAQLAARRQAQQARLQAQQARPTASPMGNSRDFMI
jgi:hypothetical protein